MNRITFIYIILYLFIDYTAANLPTTTSSEAPKSLPVVSSSTISSSPSSSTQQNKVSGSTSTTIATKVVSTSDPLHHNVSTTHSSPDCVCDGVLLPRLGKNGKELEICPECKCKHEARNTTLIKVVVIIVIWIISILVIYMLFLMCLDPLLNKRVKANYQEHTNEDDETTTTTTTNIPTAMATGSAHHHQHELNPRTNVLNRVGHQQDKWKRQVLEQRRHIYDRRTMLN